MNLSPGRPSRKLATTLAISGWTIKLLPSSLLSIDSHQISPKVSISTKKKKKLELVIKAL